MDQKSEFSKWMKTIESALSGETKVDEEILEQGSCGCGAWNCPDCFPDDNNELGGLEGKQIKATIVIQPEEGEFGEEMLQQQGDEMQQQQQQAPQQQGVGMAGTHPVGQGTFDHDEEDDLDVSMPLYGEEGIEEEGDDTDVELTQQKLPRAEGGGVKLGDIVQKYVPLDNEDGEESTLSDGSELDEEGEEGNEFAQDSSDDASDVATMQNNNSTGPDFSQEDKDTQIQQIMNMQSMGFSNANARYTPEQLEMMDDTQFKSVHQQVCGGVQEATMTAADDEDRPKPTKTRTKRRDDLDAFDDILGGGNDQPLDQYKEPGQQPGADAPAAGRLPNMRTASAHATRRATGNIGVDQEMMGWMNRINPNAGAGEQDIPQEPVEPTQDVTVRNAQDVPSIISNAMQAAGTASPEWHTINNLPGYNHRNVRGMGRNVFGMFTSTPLEQIKTIANVNGQGPNTDAEIRAVASFLINNADDLGEVHLSHGEAIPGYEPDVKEYSIDGVRFHVVRDPMGQYIYAYPDADARINTNRARLGGQGGEPQAQGRLPGGRPQIQREGSEMKFKLSITEAIKLDDIIREGLSDIARNVLTESEIDEAKTGAEYRAHQGDKKKAAMAARGAGMPQGNYPLSRRLGTKPGGKALITWMHKGHKLSNEAELEPVPFDKEIMNKQFKSHPDDFVIVSASNGVAGIKPSKEHYDQKRKTQPSYSGANDSTLPYQIVAFKDNGEQVDPTLLQPRQRGEVEKIKQRMGKLRGADMQNEDNIFKLLQDQIGTLQTVWISGFGGFRGDPDSVREPTGSVERDKMAKRADMKKGPADLDQNQALKTVFKRVRPVMKKLAAEAMSMLTRSAQRSMNGGDMETAQKLMTRATKLKQFGAILDTTADINLDGNYGSNTRDFTNQLQNALAKSANTRVGTPEYKEFLNAAAQGNAMALKPVLDALRDNLVELQ
jgi:hypothetical protein